MLRVVNPTGRSLTVQARDSTGAQGQTTVTVGTPFDPVGDLSASQGSGLSGSVSWSAPANTGGAPIAHYTVTTSGGVPTKTTSSTSVTLPNLHPGILYVITVYPVNTKGVTGPAASTTLQVIPVCTDTFTGGADGTGTDWNTAANWSGGYVPGPGDWVCVNGNVTLDNGTTTIQGLEVNFGTISIPSGANLTINNTFSDNGFIGGPGTLTLASGTQSTLGQNGYYEGGFFNALQVVNNGSLQVEAGGSGCYTNQGFNGGSVLQNAGTLSLDDGAQLEYCGDGDVNNKVVNKAGGTISYNSASGTGQATLDVPVEDSGAVTVTRGTLVFDLGTGSGSPTFSGGGTLDLTGSGSLPSGVSMAGLSELEVSGSLTVGTTLNLNAVLVNVNFGTISIPSGANLTINNTFSDNGFIGGPGTLTLASGTQSTLGQNGYYEGGFFNALQVVNNGSLQVEAGGSGCYTNQGFNGGSVLQNAGTLSLDDGAQLEYCGDGDVNNKVVNKAGGTISYNSASGTGQATLDVPVEDSGAVTVARGTLVFDLGTGSGSPTFSGGGTLDLTGSGSLPSGVSMAGLSELEVSGSLTVGTTLNLNAVLVNVNFGTISIPSGANLTINNTFSDNGFIGGPGTLTIASGTQSTLGQNGYYEGGFFNALQVVNNGSLQVEAGGSGCYTNQGFNGGSVLQNAGTLSLDDGAQLEYCGDGDVNNKVVNKAGGTISYNSASGTGQATLDVPVEDSGAVTVTRGTLVFDLGTGSGSPTFSGGGTLDLTGSGSLPSGVSMAGLSELEVSGSLTVGTTLNLNAVLVNVNFGTISIPSGANLTINNTFSDNGFIGGPGTLTSRVRNAVNARTKWLLRGWFLQCPPGREQRLPAGGSRG